MLDIQITKTTSPKAKPADESKLGFGKIFTDHMFVMDYAPDKGWHDARIVPYQPFPLDPACVIFHYAQEIFEGLKAYRTADNTIQLFRPDCNGQRMQDSADRMCIPKIPVEDFVQAVKTLVEVDKDWVPHSDGASLYIRPFVIGLDPTLGVHTSHHCQYIVIVCPVGAYYPEGLAPTKIYIEDQDVRAVRGGTGMAKTGGNYAASLRAGNRAEQKGYTQVLWLDGVHRKYIEEVGAMNVMFKVNGKILTPDLNGSVLDGITRRSCIQLLKDWGYEVEERRISAEELFQAAEDGTLEEAWGTGTAAVISPIGELAEGDKKVTVSGNKIGPITQRLYDELTGIQWGRIADPHGWTMKIC